MKKTLAKQAISFLAKFTCEALIVFIINKAVSTVRSGTPAKFRIVLFHELIEAKLYIFQVIILLNKRSHIAFLDDFCTFLINTFNWKVLCVDFCFDILSKTLSMMIFISAFEFPAVFNL
jgi:hypothetical protein